ncbi:phosphatidylinositol/phosphatidylcholine transfer protein SFH6-like protein [Tanacetum coccineum]
MQTLNRIFIINAISWFKVLWNVVQSFLEPKGKSMILHTSSSEPALVPGEGADVHNCRNENGHWCCYFSLFAVRASLQVQLQHNKMTSKALSMLKMTSLSSSLDTCTPA